MRGGVIWSNAKEGVDSQEDKKEVKYVGDEEGGKMVAVMPSLFGSRISVLISVLSLVLVIIVLSLVAGWFWGVPSRVTEQEQEVRRLESLIEKQQLMIDQLMAQKSESYMALKVRDQHPQDQDTTSAHEDICSLPPVPGPCTTASIQRWHYHPQSRTCRQFTYGGCLGNMNNFSTVMDCEAACEGYTATETKEVQIMDDDLEMCSEPPLAGPCRGQQPRYYYDPSQDSCNQFSYGGCAGNRNNFVTEDDCRNTCNNKYIDHSESDSRQLPSISSKIKKSKVSSDKSAEVCSLSMDKGPCSDEQKRWVYNREAGGCQQFIWGGCLGNFNNFMSQAKCEARCGLGKRSEQKQGRANCLKPKEQGTCRGIFERFYYNVDTETCEDFVFGGCGGNENNFLSREKCSTYCLGEEFNTTDQLDIKSDVDEENVDEICAIPRDPGSCKGHLENFYYNIVSEGCEPFTYSGCGGNKNNFDSMQACTDFCTSNKK